MPATRTFSHLLTPILFFIVAGCYSTTTMILVRHAERPPGTDPDLLPEGRARAGDLARALQRANVRAILVTSFKRTKQTAESLSAQTGVAMTEIPVAADASAHVAEVVRQLSASGGRTVVYVGHSNTVPAVISALGITPAPTIADSVFNRFFVVTKRKGSTGLIEVRYGR
ncbi:MAG TPA: histidine phosphatase family protein [Gemmatimonadaceae bacterium]|nr:histidine phosphatase family protein [Gemmatimonadaceae bacterium]